MHSQPVRIRAVVHALAFTLACVAGCVGLPAGDGEANPEAAVEAKLTPRARVITDDVHGALVSDVEGVMRFDRARVVDVDEVRVGDVVISGVDDGFVRSVIRVWKEGGQLVMETRPADITDAIDTAFISTSAVVPGEGEGGSGGGLTPTETRTDALRSTMDLSGTVLFEDRVGGVDVLVDIPEGHITFEPSVQVDIDIRGARLRSMSAVATGALSAEVNIRVQAEGEFAQSRETELRRLRHRKVLTQWVGWVPVVEVITVRYYVGYEADLAGQVQVQAGAAASGRVRAGGEYRSGRLLNLSDTHTDFEVHAPEWEQWATGAVRAYVRPEIEVALYGVVGPGIQVQPWVRLSGEEGADADGIHAQWSLDAGVSADVFFRMELFGSGRTYQRNVYDTQRRLAGGSWSGGGVAEGEDNAGGECAGRDVTPLHRFGRQVGKISGANHHTPSMCDGGEGPEAVYSMVFASTGRVCFEAKSDDFHPVLHVRTACDDLATERACAGGAWGAPNAFSLNVTEGERYFVFVDGLEAGDGGEFALTAHEGPCP